MSVAADVEDVVDAEDVVVLVVVLVVDHHHHQGLVAVPVADQNGERDVLLDATPSATFNYAYHFFQPLSTTTMFSPYSILSHFHSRICHY